jgi:hypothetical protein
VRYPACDCGATALESATAQHVPERRGASCGSAPVGRYEYTPYSLVKSTIAWTVSGLPSSIAVPKDMM